MVRAIMEQSQEKSAGTSCASVAEVKPAKASVERHRRWFQGVFWLAFFMTIFTTRPSVDNASLRIVINATAFALVTAATVGRLWCSLYVRGRKSKQFCQDGPYSICRNPLYLSSFLGGIGIAVASDRAVLMILFPLLFWGFYIPVIRAEERRLSELFGGEYEAYCARVPRIIPRFKNYSGPETVTVTVGHYLRGIVKSLGYFWTILAVQLVEMLRSSSPWFR